MNQDPEHIFSVANHFQTSTKPLSLVPVTTGHINDSFFIFTGGNDPSFILQRINHHIFRNVGGLMSNISKVLRHLESSNLNKHGFVPLRLIPAKDGSPYFIDREENYWRMYNFIPGSISYDVISDPKIAREAGKAFGTFQLLTAGLDGSSLVETIPDFHNISARLKTFRETVARDPEKRAAAVEAEIRFAEDRADEMHRILSLGEAGTIPLRVTHNDTKINNILFNTEGRALCIVDLDTVMPGYVLYDFGDAIRTGASAAAEDEEDLSKVDIRMDLFDAYSDGYLSVAKEFLVNDEVNNLAFSARFMTFIIGLRFLTDHIDGDHYYRIHRENHNLIRARSQFRLVKRMEERSDEMEQTIRKYTQKNI